MKRILLIAAMVAVIVVAFYRKSKIKTAETMVAADSYSSQYSLDWDGVYTGVLPCADCEGLQKTIYLKKDLSYRIKMKHLGIGDNFRESSGKFNWNTQGNTITFYEPGKQQVSYVVGKNTLTQLDRNGKKITGELAAKYILCKAKYALLEEEMKKMLKQKIK
jgi:uncharacterized lipoprotein NlpE involved in copper resistance